MAIWDSCSTYGLVTRFFHWLVASLVLVNIFIGLCHDVFWGHRISHELMMVHKSIGLSLIPVMVLFILWSSCNKKPDWPTQMKPKEISLAKWAHRLLYFSVLAMSLTGWFWLTAAGHAPSWFGLKTFVAPWLSGHLALAAWFSDLHLAFAWILCLLLILHVAAAIKHQFVDKDGLISRMI